MVGAARRSTLAPTGSRIALMNELCQELNAKLRRQSTGDEEAKWELPC